MDACRQESKRSVKIPRSSTGKSLSYSILIERICPRRALGNVFEGRRLRPGARIAQGDLWPTPDHPKTPLLLEYAGSDRLGSGHKRSCHTYILWRFDVGEGKWVELIRVMAEALEWIEVIRTVALKNFVSSGRELSAIERATVATSRVLQVLEKELEVMENEERTNFLGFLYEQFTARLVRDGVGEALNSKALYVLECDDPGADDAGGVTGPGPADCDAPALPEFRTVTEVPADIDGTGDAGDFHA